MKDVERFLNDKGQIHVWPKKHVDKQLVLQYLASKFEMSKNYTETEVNDILNTWHTFQDWPLLRRSLIDSAYMTRDSKGHAYQRIK